MLSEEKGEDKATRETKKLDKLGEIGTKDEMDEKDPLAPANSPEPNSLFWYLLSFPELSPNYSNK